MVVDLHIDLIFVLEMEKAIPKVDFYLGKIIVFGFEESSGESRDSRVLSFEVAMILVPK